MKAGDTLTYSFTRAATGTAAAAPGAYLTTRTISNVKSDSSFTSVTTWSDGSTRVQFDLDVDFQEIGYLRGNTLCTNSPKVDSPGNSLTVGQTWDLRYTRTCVTNTSSTSTQFSNRGSVTAIEDFTTPAGTFTSYKLVYVVIATSSAGQTTSNFTCWRSRILNRTVSCDFTDTFTAVGNAAPTSTEVYTQRLIATNVTNYPSNIVSPARFAGNWSLTWAGSNTGTCAIVVAASGTLSGPCQATSPVQNSTVTGSVDAAGTLRGTTTSGASFVGSMTSPMDASGNWTNVGASGTWRAIHQ